MATAAKVFRLLLLPVALLVSDASSAANPGDDPAVTGIANDDVHLLLTSRKYPELERLFGGYLEAYKKGRTDEDRLAERFAAVDRSGWPDSLFDEWLAAYPKSYSARLARGIHRAADAWMKRGSNFSRDTTDNQLREFTDALKQ